MREITLFSILIFPVIASGQSFEPYEFKIPGTERPFVMTPIHGGSFVMGNNEGASSEKPEHDVEVGDFWMSSFETTWEQYDAFVFREKSGDVFVDNEMLSSLGIDGVSGATTPYAEMSGGMGKEGYPAVNMTQYAALTFCKWLSALTGQFYRLPTEAEWEYACKIGTGEKEDLRDVAVFSVDKYAKVGSMKANVLGIYDMKGNASEWTMDQFDPSFYSKSPVRDPWLKPEKLYPRVVRGGSWRSTEEAVMCTARSKSTSKWKSRDPQLPKSRWWHTNAPFVGFRIVRPRVQPDQKEIEKYWLEAMEDYSN